MTWDFHRLRWEWSCSGHASGCGMRGRNVEHSLGDPVAQCALASAVEIDSRAEWTFYTQVSVSGPSVSTTVHRSESLRGARASLTRDPEADARDEDYRDPEVRRRAVRTTGSGDRGR